MKNSVLSNTGDLYGHISDDDDIVILIIDELIDSDDHIVTEFECIGNVYELRLLESSTDSLTNYTWNGKIYCRHGGECHPSWWVLERNHNFFIQLNSRIQDDISIENVEVCVYVKKHDTDMTMIRDQLMTYIGGQSRVQCETHRMPLIVSKENKCCYQHVEGSSDLCGRKISLRCPDLHCNCGICKQCEGNMALSGNIFISPNDNI